MNTSILSSRRPWYCVNHLTVNPASRRLRSAALLAQVIFASVLRVSIWSSLVGRGLVISRICRNLETNGHQGPDLCGQPSRCFHRSDRLLSLLNSQTVYHATLSP